MVGLGLQNFLLQYQESGKVGQRQKRWCTDHLLLQKQDDEIWLLTISSKNQVENIPAHVLPQIAKEIENV
jgi:hypothetical protein